MSADRPIMLARATRMRREPTEAERRLWSVLRNSQLGGFKFRRQAVIGGRIADFFCPAKGLIVEIDGDTHEPAHDAVRDVEVREARGFETVRFYNHDIMENPQGVQQQLLSTLEALPDRWPGTTPNPSSEVEGRQI